LQVFYLEKKRNESKKKRFQFREEIKTGRIQERNGKENHISQGYLGLYGLDNRINIDKETL
jgi:hypothetical protein